MSNKVQALLDELSEELENRGETTLAAEMDSLSEGLEFDEDGTLRTTDMAEWREQWPDASDVEPEEVDPVEPTLAEPEGEMAEQLDDREGDEDDRETRTEDVEYDDPDTSEPGPEDMAYNTINDLEPEEVEPLTFEE